MLASDKKKMEVASTNTRRRRPSSCTSTSICCPDSRDLCEGIRNNLDSQWGISKATTARWTYHTLQDVDSWLDSNKITHRISTDFYTGNRSVRWIRSRDLNSSSGRADSSATDSTSSSANACITSSANAFITLEDMDPENPMLGVPVLMNELRVLRAVAAMIRGRVRDICTPGGGEFGRHIEVLRAYHAALSNTHDRIEVRNEILALELQCGALPALVRMLESDAEVLTASQHHIERILEDQGVDHMSDL